MGNAIYRKQGGVPEYQYWSSSFGLSPLKTIEYPFQFIEENGSDYFLYVSQTIFIGSETLLKTNGGGSRYIASGLSWTYVEDIVPFDYYSISGNIIYANADIEEEPV